MQLVTIPFARSHKEISSEEMESHSQSCKHAVQDATNIYVFCTEYVEKFFVNTGFV